MPSDTTTRDDADADRRAPLHLGPLPPPPLPPPQHLLALAPGAVPGRCSWSSPAWPGSAWCSPTSSCRPRARRLAETSFICTREVTGRCGPDNAAAQLNGEENRVIVPYRRIPEVLIDAVIAAEDQNFWEHNGVDPAGIARAGWAQVSGQQRVRAGWVDHHPAVREDGLPDQRAHHRPQDPGGHLRRRARAGALQGGDPRALPEHRLLRSRRLRRAGGRAGLLLQGRRGPRPCTDAAYLAGLIRSPETADADRQPRGGLPAPGHDADQHDWSWATSPRRSTTTAIAVDVGRQPLRHLPRTSARRATSCPGPRPSSSPTCGATTSARSTSMRPCASSWSSRFGEDTRLRRRPAGVHHARLRTGSARPTRRSSTTTRSGAPDLVDRRRRGRRPGAGDDGRARLQRLAS